MRAGSGGWGGRIRPFRLEQAESTGAGRRKRGARQKSQQPPWWYQVSASAQPYCHSSRHDSLLLGLVTVRHLVMWNSSNIYIKDCQLESCRSGPPAACQNSFLNGAGVGAGDQELQDVHPQPGAPGRKAGHLHLHGRLHGCAARVTPFATQLHSVLWESNIQKHPCQIF